MERHVELVRSTEGLILGTLAVVSFSLTLPMTQLADAAFDPVIVGAGRGAVAAGVAALLLWYFSPPLPEPHQFRRLGLVACGAVLGFPLCTAWAMRSVPASHGGVVLAILPLATVAAGALFAGERPSIGFWITAAAGTTAVVCFVVRRGNVGGIGFGDLALLGAIVSAAVAYAQGAQLARSLGGWQVICWALVLALPVTLAVTASGLYFDVPHRIPWVSWLALAYVALISQLFGFFLWYRALAVGGVARVSQIQLLQPLFTLIAAYALLDEAVGPEMLLFAVVIVALVALGRRMPVGTRRSR